MKICTSSLYSGNIRLESGNPLFPNVSRWPITLKLFAVYVGWMARSIEFQVRMVSLPLTHYPIYLIDFSSIPVWWKCILCEWTIGVNDSDYEEIEKSMGIHQSARLRWNIQSLCVLYSSEYILQRIFVCGCVCVCVIKGKIWRIRTCVMFVWYSLWVIFSDLGTEKYDSVVGLMNRIWAAQRHS